MTTPTERLYDAAGNQMQQDLTPFGPMPAGALALKFADDVGDAEWITGEDLLTEMRREDAPLAYVSIANCTGCGDPVMRHEATWHGGCCYCPECEAAPAEGE